MAASSAFPFLLSPVTLKNYPHPDFKLPGTTNKASRIITGIDVAYYWARNRAMFVNDAEFRYLHPKPYIGTYFATRGGGYRIPVHQDFVEIRPRR